MLKLDKKRFNRGDEYIMKLTDIDTNNISNEIIKKVLFNTPKNEYLEADCLIVFGCHLKPLLDERIKTVLEILKVKKVDKILLTGGIGVAGDFNESEYMKEVLLKNNVKEEIILIEDKSTTTEENIINSIEILKNNNLIENKTIILVSNQAHLKRIGMELKKQLKDNKFEIIYEYPSSSLTSFENFEKNNELRVRAVNEIKKIRKFIDMGIVDDENI
ncbi:MAG: YdcF family protein [Bacilli bacterium]|nr:YdcF family protein [Bacilli bacterium]